MTVTQHAMNAMARRLAELSGQQRQKVLAGLSESELQALAYDWAFWGRLDQLPPPDRLWRVWLLLGGRGSGKTRASSEAVRRGVESGERRQIGIIGPTADAVRRIQVEGPSGLLACSPPWCQAGFEPSTRRVVWPNGAVAHLFSAEEPDRLRGPNLDFLWADELCSMANGPAVWDMAMMALRVRGPLGHPPQAIISTTPKPSKLLRAIMAAPTTVVTRAKTSDNAANLDASTLAYYHDRYAGTRLGRQELDAELLLDVEGALWTMALIDDHRRDEAPEFKRVVVGVDPAGSSKAGSAETGIVVVGRGRDDHAYVIGDASLSASPEQWGRIAVESYRHHSADRIVVERNYGGEMARHVIGSVDRSVRVQLVQASRGKQIRAEPVVSLYEQGKVHHVGHFATLEDQMTGWAPMGNDPSPDRLDALVWAISELMVTGNQPWVTQSLNSFFRGEQPGQEVLRRDHHIWTPLEPWN